MQTAALVDWVLQKGGELRSVAVAHDERKGRLIRSTADIAAGQVVIRIPRPALLTLDIARRSSVGRQILAADIDSPSGHAFLAAYLLLERRRPGSLFAAYLGALPATFPTVPLFCQSAVMPLLRGSLAARLIKRRTELLRRDFIAMRREVPALRDMVFREFLWARTIVITRVFGLTMGGTSTEALVPLGDLMNHGRPADVDWTYDDAEGAFLMKASRDILGGREIFDSYGRKPNGRFFVHYGFALESGADDEIEVELSMSPGDPRAGAKLAALRRSVGEEGPYRLTNLLRGDETRKAFSFLRAAAAGEREMGRVIRHLETDSAVPPLSPRSEAAALSQLDRACAESLKRFDSPEEDEAEELARPDLPINVRHALLVRRGEKRLLRAYRRLASAAIPLLRLPRGAFFTAATHYSGDALTTNYLLDTALALAPPAGQASELPQHRVMSASASLAWQGACSPRACG